MIGDVNLTDLEIYKVLLKVDEVPQDIGSLVCALCQLRLLHTRYWKILSALLNIPTAHAWYS